MQSHIHQVGVSLGSETEYVVGPFFHMDMFIVPLGPFLWSSRPLAQFVLRRFSGVGDVVSFQNVVRHDYSIMTPLQPVMLFKIKRGIR